VKAMAKRVAWALILLYAPLSPKVQEQRRDLKWKMKREERKCMCVPAFEKEERK